MVAELSQWLDELSPAIESKAGTMDARAAKLIPESLSGYIAVREAGTVALAEFHEARDASNARRAVVLRDAVSLSHRIAVWAHHSHIGKNATNDNSKSMGQHLAAALGDADSAVGTFAAGGAMIATDDHSAIFPIRRASLGPAPEWESILARAGTSPAWIGVRHFTRARPAGPWHAAMRARIENGAMNIMPARDFDVAISLERVTPPDLLFLPPIAMMFATAFGFAVEWGPLGLAALLLALAAVLVRRRRRARLLSGRNSQ